MKSSFLKKRKVASEDMSLQITSMADIFVILLVFLLKGYSTGATITPTQGLILPTATAAEANFEALKIEVSETAVQVEGKPMSNLKNFRFEKGDIQQNGSVKDLSAALERERKRQLLIAEKNTDVKVDAKVLIIADQKVPYSTIKAVLASAAVNGYTDFKLATTRAE